VVIRRGEIWWGALPVPRGSEPGLDRPVLVIQSDAFNRSRIQTVIALVITSNVRLAHAPGNVFLNRRDSGLPRNSVVNVSQVITLDKSFLKRRVRLIARPTLDRVEAGLRLVMSL
jgi:mRNA interferase MazF